LQMFDVANHAEKYARDLLKNGAMPGYAVICEDDSRLPLNDKGEIDEKKMEELENKWTYKWTKKLGGVRFGFGKVKIEKINLTMADSQVDKFLMESKKQICACFSVPLSCLDETDSNKATALASMKQLKMFGVFPKMALILDQLNAVFNEYFDKSYFVWVDQREAMETDQLELAQVLSILKNAGILSTNDCRKKLDETTLDGDLYNKPVSAQASVAVQGQAAGTTPAGTNQ